MRCGVSLFAYLLCIRPEICYNKEKPKLWERKVMISFASDYTEGAHEAILRRFSETAMEQLTGYGTDKYTLSAAEKIRAACACPEAEVVFLAGGTQTNQVTVDTLLRPFEGVVAAKTGHIAAHEAGAIEFTGHKVLELPQYAGKIRAEDLKALLVRFWQDENYEHMVFPGMVYISHPTEYGTLYSLAELQSISAVCREYKIPLYMDGARLGYGLVSRGTDVDLPAIAEYCDAFYIGGTKVGALCGEALVFTKGNKPEHFVARIKQHGALLAKGWVTSLQFDTLFTDGLYFRIAANAIEKADRLREAFRAKGYELFMENPTNQVFVVLENEQMRALAEKVTFSFWEIKDEDHTVVRFATSWATTEENLQHLIGIL